VSGLGARLALVLSALVILLLGSVAAFSWVRIGAIARQQAEAVALEETRALAATAGPALREVYPLSPLVNQWASATGRRVSVFDADRELAADSAPGAQIGSVATAPEVLEAFSSPTAEGRSQRFDQALGAVSFFIAVPIHGPDGAVAGVVRLGVPAAALEANAEPLRRLLLSTTFVAGVLGVALAFLAARQIAAPFRTLARAAETGSVLEQPIFASGSEEAREVARGMNRLADRVHEMEVSADAERMRLLNILENIAAAIVVVDDSERIILANPASESLFGFHASEAVDTPLIESVRDYEVAEAIRDALRGQHPVAYEVNVGPEQRLTRLVAVPYQEADAWRVALIGHDLSEARQAERLRHDFLANVSHELRTPLAGIQATLEALEMGGLEDMSTAQTFLMNARHEVSRMSTLVEGLLELSSIEMGWRRLDLRSAPIAPVLTEAVGVLSALATQRGVSITLDASGGVLNAMMDPERVHHVVVNLLHNAIKFTPSGGRVTVSARAEGDEVWVSVADTGYGIPRRDIPTLFNRMFQGDSPGPRGAGLGLSIVKQIVEAHGGRVWVESEEGKGSTFTFSLARG
jgi:two-component system phosphate regulon sensor histidine kinase PhoR